MLTVALVLCLNADAAPREIQPATTAPIVYVTRPAPWSGKKIAGLSLTLAGSSALVAGAGIVLYGLSVLANGGNDGFVNAVVSAAVWYIATISGAITATAGLAMLIPGAVLLGTSNNTPPPQAVLPAKHSFSASFGF